MTHTTCRLTAKNRDRRRNPVLGNRVWATFTFLVCLSFALEQLQNFDHTMSAWRCNTGALLVNRTEATGMVIIARWLLENNINV